MFMADVRFKHVSFLKSCFSRIYLFAHLFLCPLYPVLTFRSKYSLLYTYSTYIRSWYSLMDLCARCTCNYAWFYGVGHCVSIPPICYNVCIRMSVMLCMTGPYVYWMVLLCNIGSIIPMWCLVRYSLSHVYYIFPYYVFRVYFMTSIKADHNFM